MLLADTLIVFDLFVLGGELLMWLTVTNVMLERKLRRGNKMDAEDLPRRKLEPPRGGGGLLSTAYVLKGFRQPSSWIPKVERKSILMP